MVYCTVFEGFFVNPDGAPNTPLCKRPVLCSELMWFLLGGLQWQEKGFLWVMCDQCWNNSIFSQLVSQTMRKELATGSQVSSAFAAGCTHQLC